MASLPRGRAKPHAKETFEDVLARQLVDADDPVIELPTGTVVDFSGVTLKPDHEKRPFWVTPTGRIFLEGE
jgi:hypothetical protein